MIVRCRLMSIEWRRAERRGARMPSQAALSRRMPSIAVPPASATSTSSGILPGAWVAQDGQGSKQRMAISMWFSKPSVSVVPSRWRIAPGARLRSSPDCCAWWIRLRWRARPDRSDALGRLQHCDHACPALARRGAGCAAAINGPEALPRHVRRRCRDEIAVVHPTINSNTAPLVLKGSDLSAASQNELNAIANRLNERRRRILDYQTPREVFAKLLAEEQLNASTS